MTADQKKWAEIHRAYTKERFGTSNISPMGMMIAMIQEKITPDKMDPTTETFLDILTQLNTAQYPEDIIPTLEKIEDERTHQTISAAKDKLNRLFS